MDQNYVPYQQIFSLIGEIQEGDIVYLSSDIKMLIYNCIHNKEIFSEDKFLDSMIEKIGTEGTLMVPTFNWDWCDGNAYDYYGTPCKTGALGTAALKRQDFKRTKHPIYSFAVCGKGRDYLCSLENKDSWGEGTPFDYMYKYGAKAISIGIQRTDALTFRHHIEQMNDVPYRYHKDFTAEYTDENGNTEKRTYGMFVRRSDLTYIRPDDNFTDIIKKLNVLRQQKINNVLFSTVDLRGIYAIESVEIACNYSRNMYHYDGQPD